MDILSWHSVGASLLYSVIGLVVFLVTFTVIDIATPRFKLWVELIEKQNTALAIFLGALAIGMAIIISAAIHG